MPENSEEINMQEVVLFKDGNGEVKQATSFATVSREEIEERIDHHTAEAKKWQEALNEYDRLSIANAPANDVPAQEEVVAQPEVPAPAEAQPAPVTPVEQVAASVDTSV